MKRHVLLLAPLLLAACAGTTAHPPPGQWVEQPSANADERVQVRFLVMHYTAHDFAYSLHVLSEPNVNGRNVSAHYLLPEEGDPSYKRPTLLPYRLVPESQRAWHAGLSRWEDRQNLNDQSIGIENVNQAECFPVEDAEPLCIYPDYSPTQLQLLLGLSQEILARHPDITPTRVVGHSDIAPLRKTDPGPRFPWQWLARNGVGAWYETGTVLKHHRVLKDRPDDSTLLLRAMRAYGYGVPENGLPSGDAEKYIRAFQMHFRPWEVTGQASAATIATALALVEKYFPDRLEKVLLPASRVP
ncbi:N-acetylmuramoyl-L-alanine amidase [Chitinimonas arctica]|uniref:N-acetylmuramoyl-L-alanine amidase n=1 Tax=Chitinimonas arctica TaxID=2594795 RepID=A0A516SA29_9NEIS|nr:N-acetylmuramoyl-L-alanine amidase [Chitinimonas arctica]QDQ25000.1 N-acetylmuramoyl-L-alanine amidase [Chitinimonas arctica]